MLISVGLFRGEQLRGSEYCVLCSWHQWSLFWREETIGICSTCTHSKRLRTKTKGRRATRDNGEYVYVWLYQFVFSDNLRIQTKNYTRCVSKITCLFITHGVIKKLVVRSIKRSLFLYIIDNKTNDICVIYFIRVKQLKSLIRYKQNTFSFKQL